MTSVPPPPKPAPKPGRIKAFKALYNYTSQHPDEISFEEGDIIYVSDIGAEGGWWRATCNGKTGLIPNNYVAEQTESIDFPLHEAVKRGNMDFMQQCLKNGVSVNGLDKSGSTPLYWAAHGGHIECLKTLLQAPNTAVNSQNKLGDTALHGAAWKGHTVAVRMLLEAGAKTNLKNNEGHTAFDLANMPETAALLKRASVSETPVDLDEYEDSDDEGDD